VEARIPNVAGRLLMRRDSPEVPIHAQHGLQGCESDRITAPRETAARIVAESPPASTAAVATAITGRRTRK